MAHVLVVDDDATIQELLRDILRHEGHEVAEASDGHAALDFLRTTSHRWVVLLEDGLPVLDGQAVLKAVADDSFLAHRHAYIACPDAARRDAPVAAVRAALGVPLLPKPYDVQRLVEAIAQAEARLQGTLTH